MKRKLAVWALLAALGGWAAPAAHAGKFMSQARSSPSDGARWGARYAPELVNYVGPRGEPIAQRVGSEFGEPTGADYAHAMIAKQFPGEVLSQVGVAPHPGVTSAALTGPAQGGLMQTSGHGPNPAGNPMVAGVPGIIPPGPPGAVAAIGAGGGPSGTYGVHRTEVRFTGPGGMKISWYAPRADGKAGFATQYLEAPARYNFLQSSIYRLKLSDIPERPGVDLYPTLEIVPANPKTATFLAHSAVPITFTAEDFEQVAAGNFVVKVIYLPDPAHQDLAATGPDEVVSSRLEPGVDPVLEAKRRGSILAIIRLGNIDLEAPNTPAMDAPDPKMVQAMQQQMMMAMQQQQMMRSGMVSPNMAGMQGAGMMPPPGMMPPGMAGQPGMAGMRPGMMPPGMVPPGMVPPGMVPPGMMRPGMAPPAATGAVPPSAGPGLPPSPSKTSPVGKQTSPGGLFRKAPSTSLVDLTGLR